MSGDSPGAAGALRDGPNASRQIRVAIIRDMRAERWPSMDLVADSLLTALRSAPVSALEVEHVLRHRFSAAGASAGRRFTLDRAIARLVEYPRSLQRPAVAECDAFHIVDHSYSHLVHALPANRTVVTCHDLDTFRSVLEPSRERRGWPFRRMAAHILSGLRRAGHVTCVSSAVRAELLSHGIVPAERVSVVFNGVSDQFTPFVSRTSDETARALLPASALDAPLLLHVGSTITRKRIEDLLEILALVRAVVPRVRLLRVGGALTRSQSELAARLGVSDAIVTLPFVTTETLAAIYRMATLVLQPSSAEGFGLPVAEALACGTPVIASDLAVLREVGGSACTYCASGDHSAWSTAVIELIAEAAVSPERRHARRARGLEQAAKFSWRDNANKMAEIYRELAVA